MISTNIHPWDEWTALQDLQLNDTSLSMVWVTVINDESGVKLTYHSIYINTTHCEPEIHTAPQLKLIRHDGFSKMFTFATNKRVRCYFKTIKQWYIYHFCWRTWLISAENCNFLINVSLVTAAVPVEGIAAVPRRVPHPLSGNSLDSGGKGSWRYLKTKLIYQIRTRCVWRYWGSQSTANQKLKAWKKPTEGPKMQGNSARYQIRGFF